MTEQEMQMWIASSLGMNVNAIPNVLLDAGDGRGWYEADLVYFRGNGYLFEVEIKTSFNDFKKDFEKSAYHTSRQVRGLYYAFPHTLWDERQQSIIELLGEKNPKAGIMLVSGRDATGLPFVFQRAKLRKDALPLNREQQLAFFRLGCRKWWKREYEARQQSWWDEQKKFYENLSRHLDEEIEGKGGDTP
ncbi:hypothetical protein [Megasphaera elsdenii]